MVEHLLGAERQGQLTSLGLEVAGVHSRAIALCELDSLVSQAAHAVDEDTLGGSGAKLTRHAVRSAEHPSSNHCEDTYLGHVVDGVVDCQQRVGSKSSDLRDKALRNRHEFAGGDDQVLCVATILSQTDAVRERWEAWGGPSARDRSPDCVQLAPDDTGNIASPTEEC